jgi:hypothetical protein
MLPFMPACQHCESTELQPFSPVSHAQTHGAVLLCRGCRRITIALPARRARRTPASQASASLPTAA